MNGLGHKTVDPELVAAVSRKMPTFKNDAFDVSDTEQFCAGIGFTYSPEQVEEYKKFWIDNCNGKVPCGILQAIFCVIDDTSKVMRELVLFCDANKDGLISEDEFKAIMRIILAFDPAFKGINFENFVQEADANKDGVISTEEAIAWFTKAANK